MAIENTKKEGLPRIMEKSTSRHGSTIHHAVPRGLLSRPRLRGKPVCILAPPTHFPTADSEQNLASQFIAIREKKLRGVIHRSWSNHFSGGEALLDALRASPAMAIDERAGQGKLSCRKMLGTVIYCKIYEYSTLSRYLRDLFGMGRALREWKANCACGALGIRTALVRAALTCREGLCFTHYFLTAKAPGLETAEIIKRLRHNRRKRRAFLRQLGRYVASLHERGFWHAHLSLRHIFFTPDGQGTLIDLERSMIRRILSPRKIKRNIWQLQRRLRHIVPPEDLGEFEFGYRNRMVLFDPAYAAE
jgi:hypothetical protein